MESPATMTILLEGDLLKAFQGLQNSILLGFGFVVFLLGFLVYFQIVRKNGN